MKITVTIWTHPESPSRLVLEGTPEQTRENAIEYLVADGLDSSLLQGNQEVWAQDAYTRLPEFEGY
jgi:hypothetical protein